MQKRTLIFLVAAVGAIGFGGYLTYVERHSYGAPILARDLVAPMGVEVAEAARLGMRETRDGQAVLHGSVWEDDFRVETNQCVALVAGVTGVAKIASLEWRDAGGHTLASVPSAPATHVAQVQWCAREASMLRARLALWDTVDPVPTLHWTFASGPRGPGLDERTLTRNASADDAVREALDRAEDAATIARFADPARATEIALLPDALERSEPLRVDERSAVLVPPERLTFLAARRALMTPDATPALAPYFTDVPAWLQAATPLPQASGTESAALLRVRGGWERVLSVVDFDALTPACAAVTFARLAEPAPDAPVVRVAIPSLARTPLTERDNVWTDRVCPATNLHLYVIPASAAARYDVRLHALPGTRPRVRRRGPAWDGAFLVSEERTEFARSCDARDAAAPVACLALARALERDDAAPIDVDAAFERACTRGSADACGQLSARLGARATTETTERAIALERTACANGAWISCASRAARLARAPTSLQDITDAGDLYHRACNEGHLAGACRNEARMRELQLLPSE